MEEGGEAELVLDLGLKEAEGGNFCGFHVDDDAGGGFVHEKFGVT